MTEISYGAYYHCTRLTSIVITAGVKKICEHAFEGCTGLTSIVLPDGVTEIGYLAFSECPSLEELDFTLCRDCYGYDAIDTSAFMNNPQLKLILPSNLESQRQYFERKMKDQ